MENHSIDMVKPFVAFFFVYLIWSAFISTSSVGPVYMVLAVGVSPLLAQFVHFDHLGYRWFVGENCCGTKCC